MNYIEEIAELIYWVNDPHADDISDDDMELSRIYAVLAFAKGEDTTLEDVHHAWAAWRSGNFDAHPDLVPFDDLAPDIQERDRPYMDAIHQVARLIHEWSEVA